MKHKIFKTKIFSIAALFFVFGLFSSADAQSISSSLEFLTSWRADNYAPEWYLGKFLPIVGSSIQVNFELIDGGKPMDLSKNIVRWYVNGDLVKNESDGLGIKSLATIIPKNSGNKMLIRISVVDYDAGPVLEKVMTIPVLKPEAVIDFPYASDKVGSGLSILKLTPFFFNINNLNELEVKWSVNGVDYQLYENEDSAWQLDLNVESQMASGFKINLGAFVKNQLNQLESANSVIALEKK